MSTRQNKRNGKLGLIISFVIGVGLGILVAPRTGDETRRILSEIGKQYESIVAQKLFRDKKEIFYLRKRIIATFRVRRHNSFRNPRIEQF